MRKPARSPIHRRSLRRTLWCLLLALSPVPVQGGGPWTASFGSHAAPPPSITRTAEVQGRRPFGRTPPRLQGVVRLRSYLRALIRRKEFATTRWGIRIESLNRNQLLFDHEGGQLFTPASNTKLYTTATALVRLGPDYRARTSVFAQAPPDDKGLVHGDLVLYGRGAVDLRSPESSDGQPSSFDQLAGQLQQAGLREIEGSLVADESYFAGPRLGVGWEWDDLQWPSGAEVSALSVDDNLLAISVSPDTSIGQPALVSVRPANSIVQMKPRVTTTPAGAAPDLGLRRGLEDDNYELWGSLPQGIPPREIRAAVHDPALVAGDLLLAALRRRGIGLRGKLVRASDDDRKDSPVDFSTWRELAYLESAPISEVIRGVNKPSQNLHAEILLRTLGVIFRREGSDRMGLSVVTDFLHDIDAPIESASLRDGSGLSRHNLVTPALTIALLRFMSRSPYSQPFLDSLPIAGVDGTLKNRMVATSAQQKVRAKTGTLTYTTCLSGYVTSRRGERLVFSIMVNNETGALSEAIRAIDEICISLSNWAR